MLRNPVTPSETHQSWLQNVQKSHLHSVASIGTHGDRSRALAQFQSLLSDSPKKEILLQLAGLTGDAYHVQRLRTEGSDDYEQTFTEKGNIMTFTAKYNDDYSPAISPDGKWVAFASNRLQNAELYLIDLTDRSLRQLTHTDELDEYMPAFSPDGKSIAFATERTRGGMMLHLSKQAVLIRAGHPSISWILMGEISVR